MIASVGPLLNKTTMYEGMEERAKLSGYMIAVGSTNASKSVDYIVETCSDTQSYIDYESDSTDDDDGGNYLEAGTRRAGVEELAIMLPPWSTQRERVRLRWMWV